MGAVRIIGDGKEIDPEKLKALQFSSVVIIEPVNWLEESPKEYTSAMGWGTVLKDLHKRCGDSFDDDGRCKTCGARKERLSEDNIERDVACWTKK